MDVNERKIQMKEHMFGAEEGEFVLKKPPLM